MPLSGFNGDCRAEITTTPSSIFGHLTLKQKLEQMRTDETDSDRALRFAELIYVLDENKDWAEMLSSATRR